MPRLTLLMLGIVAALVGAAPAGAASVATSRPAVPRTLTAAKRSCSSTTYRAPLTGYLDVRLRASGDWDLRLRDALGTTLATSRGFGGSEVAQAWVRAGQRITARGCRGRGAGPSARTTFRLAAIALPKLALGPAQLLRVTGGEKQLQALEDAGLDVTHSQGLGWADVIVGDAAQLATVIATGLRYTVRIANLSASYADARAADRRYSTRVGAAGTGLPTGRTGYRTYADVQSELKALVDENAGIVRKVVFGTSYEGREISGVEIARNVATGRPARVLPHGPAPRARVAVDGGRDGVRAHARPAAGRRSHRRPADARADRDPAARQPRRLHLLARCLRSRRLARQAGPERHARRGDRAPGGLFAYRRKNCDGKLTPALPCELAWGVDPNRNYGYGWGGPGSSSDVTSQSYHGPAPRSEPEVQAVWNYVRTHEVTTLLTLHNVAALVLRPPGASTAGPAPDEARMKALGDRMAAAAGYTSEYGYQLYETTGTTEDDSYAATGGYGYTIEMGPPGGNFHMPYQTGVVDEWTGHNAHAQSRGGLREALLIAAGAAADDADHAILRGSAPAGRILRLRKRFQTRTSPFCAKGIEPVVDIGLPRICLTGEKAPLTLDDELDATTPVPADGAFAWHVGESTRPFVGAIPGQKEAYVLTCERPDGTVLERLSLVIDRGQTVTLDLGCGGAATRFANGAPVGGDPAAPPPPTAPAVNGVPVPTGVATTAATPKRTAPKRKAKSRASAAAKRARKLAACSTRAGRIKGAKRRKAALRACGRQLAKRKPA